MIAAAMIHSTPSSTARDASGVATLYGSQIEAMPSTRKKLITNRLMMLPAGQRCGSSRKLRENICMPISARQIDIGTEASASQAEFGHRYSKP